MSSTERLSTYSVVQKDSGGLPPKNELSAPSDSYYVMKRLGVTKEDTLVNSQTEGKSLIGTKGEHVTMSDLPQKLS